MNNHLSSGLPETLAVLDDLTTPIGSAASAVTELRAVALAFLAVDPSYQRPEQPNLVRKLAAAWDDQRAGVIYVSQRVHGELIVIDGQQRAAARRRRAIQDHEPLHTVTLNARVYRGLTTQQEAALFVAFNGDRKGVTALERFMARMTAGDPIPLQIAGIVERHGFSISNHGSNRNGSNNSRALSAVSTLESIFSRFGADTLGTALDITHESFRAVEGGLLAAIAEFIVYYRGQYDRQRLVHILTLTGAARIKQQVGAIAGVNVGSGPSGSPGAFAANAPGKVGYLDNAWGMVLVSLYNKGLRTRQLPEWRSRSRSRTDKDEAK